MAYNYKVMGQTVQLDIDPSVVAVRFKGKPPHSTRAEATNAAGVGPFSRRYEVPGEPLTIVPVSPDAGNPAGMGPASAIRALNNQPDVSQAEPVFRVGANQVIATDRLIVGLDDPSIKQALAGKYNLEIVKDEAERTVFRAPENADVFDLCTKLDSEKGVRFAEPDFVTIGRHLPKRVAPQIQPLLDDPMVSSQYAMRITRAIDAWTIQTGDPEVKIAILDEGVDTMHRDLASAIAGTFDASDDDTFQDPNPWDGHGTACAGLAAAIGNNAIGIKGVGAGCSILTVRIARSEFSGGPWITSNEMIARAIDWSWQHDAAVLSNSWGGGPPSNAIQEAFERARTLGRNGKGCVIVIAAGNDAGPVTFPGTLPDILTVSASNEFDEIKTKTSSDGENWWGTCFGPEIDVAAPGVHNLTTDISGSAGYAGGDYTPKFNGTSSATPIVAGACGLVLSANPDLTEAEVRDIIRGTAAKAGALPYVAGRNDFFGNGRIDVFEAVTMAQGKAVPAAGTAVASAARAMASANAAPAPQPASAAKDKTSKDRTDAGKNRSGR